MDTKHLTQAKRIQLLTEALGKIEKQCRPYDQFSQMGCLGSTAREAVLAAGETIGEKLVRWEKDRERMNKENAKRDAKLAALGVL